MKETIYTIPINEAFDSDCSCALCQIADRVENERIKATLGPAMMEPDFRINSNKKGFCRHHYRLLLENCKALPLALILQTYSKQQNDEIFANVPDKKKSSGGLFKKQSPEAAAAEKIISFIETTDKSCVICENLNDTMDRYMKNLIYIWKTEDDFRKKFASKEGFCVPHFAELLKYGKSGLNSKEFSEFFKTLVAMQEKSQQQMYEDISSFIKLFDHNSDKKADGNVKNSIRRAIRKYSGLKTD